MGKKKGKKPGEQKQEQAAGGQPEMQSAQGQTSSAAQQPGPSQQRQLVEPAARPGGDVTAGPSQQQQRRREYGPAVPPQPPEMWMQSKGPPQVPPPYEAQPPLRMRGSRGRPYRGRGAEFGRVSPRGPPRSQEFSLVAPGGAGPRGATPPPHQGRSTLPAPRGAVKKTSEDIGIASISKGVAALQIPQRKGCGTEGRRTVVETNYVSLDLSKLKNTNAYHYDVEFEPALPKRLLRYAMEEFRVRHFPDRYPAFDGRRNLYASQELPERSDTVQVHDEESTRVREFTVTIKYAAQINFDAITSYLASGRSLVPPQSAVQALDVVLRNARMSRGFVQVGRSFFTPPSGQVLRLGNGMELWYGIFQSAILGWKPFLNIDVAHKGFPKHQPVVAALEEICGNFRHWNEVRFDKKEEFVHFIRGLKVDYVLPNNPYSKRTYRVNNIADCPSNLWFQIENDQSITVHEYFARIKGVPLRQPNLPCLEVGSRNRETPIYLPSEFCSITQGQATNKKLNESQTSAMIKYAATSTVERKEKIMDALRSVNFSEDACIQEFGVSIGGRFEEVEARILQAPQLQYCNDRFASPVSGVWRPSQFFESGKLKAWIILNLDSQVRQDALRNFGERMQEMGKASGMDVSPPFAPQTMRRPAPAELENFFRSMKDNVELVFVVVPDRRSYGHIKQIAELTVGVLTQCIKSNTIKYLKPATCSNILLKVNSKLNGVNHVLSPVSKPPCLTRPAMIVGADVTHPPPDQTNKPSVAAVCASYDPQAFRYNIQIRLQPPKAEIIKDMEAIMKEQLKYFWQKSGQKPERIIFYRDGVSDGQFDEVLRNEVNAIRRACASLEPGYEPMVTFLVVQKRHHTRFFPTRREDENGKNRNVPPGTVVDTKITHRTELDFFLVSHASIQGVSRPTKYHLLWNDDDNMTTDELEQLTYYLCHMFSRCTRSVSYPAPTYNAHLAAYRAGVYLGDRAAINLQNLEREQMKYFESDVLKTMMKTSPMYFV